MRRKLENEGFNMNTIPESPNVQGHPASVDAYLRHGWKLVPIPMGRKGPVCEDWNKPGNQLQRAADLPPQAGIGLCHAYSGTVALDIDDWDRAKRALSEQGIDLDQLYNAMDAVTIDSGRPGHGKLLYAMPFGLTLPSKKLIQVQTDGSKTNYLDFRCSTSGGLTVQDVLPPSIHPETHRSYTWGGKGHWSRLPLIPPSLLQFWQSLLAQDTNRSISAGQDFDTSWDEIRGALAHIDPDLDRDSWVQVGMALHWAGTQTDKLDDAFALWDEWSAGTSEKPATKYVGSSDLLNSWRGFKPESGITIGTLFHLAREAGWRRALPSAQEIFASVDVSTESEPLDIMNGLKPPPPVPDLSLFPAALAARAQEIADGVGCDPLVPLWAGIGAVCGAADARSRLELVPNFKVPPVLWCMTIGDPADKKTPGSAPMIDPLFEIEAEDRPNHKQEYLLWEAQEMAYKDARQNYLEHYKTPDFLLSNDVAPEVPNLPPPPVPLKLIVQDITSQKLVRKASDRPRGLLCYLDEMSAWAGKLSDTRSMEDRSAWVVSFESRRYEMERVGAGSIYAENLAVSIYGNIQPRVLKSSMGVLSKDGLLQRFLPAILRPAMTRLGNPVPEAFSGGGAWAQTLRTIHSIPEHTYTLSPEARALFVEFQKWYHKTLQDERIIRADEDYQTAFGKLEGQTGRLALIFHLIEDPTNFSVSADLMGRVIQVVKGYIIPALRYTYGELGGTIENNLDTWMVQHIIGLSGIEDQVTLSGLKRSAKRRIAGLTPWQQNGAVREAMSVLEASKWVAVVEDIPTKNHVIWAINPNLAESFKEYRQRVLEIKQARLDENRAIAARAGRYSKRRMVKGYEDGS